MDNNINNKYGMILYICRFLSCKDDVHWLMGGVSSSLILQLNTIPQDPQTNNCRSIALDKRPAQSGPLKNRDQPPDRYISSLSAFAVLSTGLEFRQ